MKSLLLLLGFLYLVAFIGCNTRHSPVLKDQFGIYRLEPDGYGSMTDTTQVNYTDSSFGTKVDRSTVCSIYIVYGLESEDTTYLKNILAPFIDSVVANTKYLHYNLTFYKKDQNLDTTKRREFYIETALYNKNVLCDFYLTDSSRQPKNGYFDFTWKSWH